MEMNMVMAKKIEEFRDRLLALNARVPSLRHLEPADDAEIEWLRETAPRLRALPALGDNDPRRSLVRSVADQWTQFESAAADFFALLTGSVRQNVTMPNGQGVAFDGPALESEALRAVAHRKGVDVVARLDSCVEAVERSLSKGQAKIDEMVASLERASAHPVAGPLLRAWEEANRRPVAQARDLLVRAIGDALWAANTADNLGIYIHELRLSYPEFLRRRGPATERMKSGRAKGAA